MTPLGRRDPAGRQTGGCGGRFVGVAPAGAVVAACVGAHDDEMIANTSGISA